MPGSRPLQIAREQIATRLRQKNSIYLALSLIARVLNAAGMFVAIKRFAPATFGEMSYLTATAVSTVAFCAFGIELSINAQLTRKLRESAALAPTIVAGCVLALAGTILACLVICVVFASQLRLSSSPGLAVLSVCIYSSFMISTSLLTAMSFALDASINVGISYMVTSLIFVGFAVFANAGTSGVDLMFFLICAQVIAVSYMAVALLRRHVRPSRQPAGGAGYRLLLPEAWMETKTLFVYGAKQILVVSALTFAQWLIQRKIVFGAGGASENAIYSIGNQIFNMMTFIP
jgi:O-antigen/teichoic acid export membrane protein